MTWTFAASTLGVLGEDLATVVKLFQKHSVTAVELRAAHDAAVHTRLEMSQRTQLRQTLSAAGIEIFAVASRVRIAQAGPDSQVITSLKEHLKLAADLGALFVRVFPGAPTAPADYDELPQLDDARLATMAASRRLTACLELAEHTGVRILIETHDSHPRGRDVAALLHRLDEIAPGHPVGAIWDVLHPWRVGEALAETATHLVPYLIEGRGYVQIKDVASRADKTPVLQGDGVIPLEEFLTLLAAGGYAGPISLEWERHWHPDVPPLADALAAASAALRTHRPNLIPITN